MPQTQWDAFRHFWWGLCGGVMLGLLIALFVADKPGWTWFTYTMAGAVVPIIAFVPDIVAQIVRGVSRFRSASR